MAYTDDQRKIYLNNKVKIPKSNNKIITIEATGHSGYADEGQDIVCAAVSATYLTTINGILSIKDFS